MQEAATGRDGFDSINESPLLLLRKQHKRNAANHGTDPAVPLSRDQVGKDSSVAFDNRYAWQHLAQVLRHIRNDFNDA
jgi:hypothetical protein